MATTAQLLLQIKSDMSGVRTDLRDLQRDMKGTHKVALGMGDAIKAGFGAFVGLGIAQRRGHMDGISDDPWS